MAGAATVTARTVTTRTACEEQDNAYCPCPARACHVASLWAHGGVVVCCTLAMVPTAAAPAEDALVQALLDGVAKRGEALQRFSCDAVIEATRSDACRQERRAHEVEQTRQLAESVANPTQAATLRREVPQWGEHDAVWGKPAADRVERKWTIESVALTDNGRPNPDCVPGGHPADWRRVPPGMFCCSVVCDGKTVWTYDRSRQEGMAWAYDREAQLGTCYNRVVSQLTNFSELQAPRPSLAPRLARRG